LRLRSRYVFYMWMMRNGFKFTFGNEYKEINS